MDDCSASRRNGEYAGAPGRERKWGSSAPAGTAAAAGLIFGNITKDPR